jgi:hypothetical protein
LSTTMLLSCIMLRVAKANLARGPTGRPGGRPRRFLPALSVLWGVDNQFSGKMIQEASDLAGS